MKKYAAYDSYNNKIFQEYDIGGALRTNCGNPAMRTGWKILELDTDRAMKKYLMWNDHDQQLYPDPTVAGSMTTKIGDVMGAGQKVIEIDMDKVRIRQATKLGYIEMEMGGSLIHPFRQVSLDVEEYKVIHQGVYALR